MARNCFSVAGLWVFPKRVFFALSVQHSTMTAKVPGPVRRDDRLLFSESASRFLVEVEPASAEAFARRMAAAGVAAAAVGRVTETPRVVVRGVGGARDVVSVEVAACAAAWRGALPFGHEGAA